MANSIFDDLDSFAVRPPTGSTVLDGVEVDRRLLEAFKTSRLAKEFWHHVTHIRVAYLLFQEYGFDQSLRQMREGILALNSAHGTPNTVDSGYHETITVGFLKLVAAAAERSHPELDSAAFCSAHPSLCDKNALAEFYSRERLGDQKARKEFVEPDIRPLPELGTKASPSESQRRRPATWKIMLAFATVYVVWGSTYLAIRFAVETMPPFLMASGRWLVSGACLYTFARLNNPRPSLSQWGQAIALGSLLFLGANGLVCFAEQTVPSGVTALIIATVPLWMVGLDAFFFRKQRPRAVVWLGIALGLIGVAVLLDPFGGSPNRIDPFGAMAVCGACFFWSIGSLWGRSADLPASLLQAVGMKMLGGGLTLFVVGSCLGEWSVVDLDAISTKSLLALAYLIFIGGMLTFSTYFWLMRVCEASSVSTYAYVNPVIAVLLGTWLGNEPFTSKTLIGAILIVFSVLIIMSFRHARGSREPIVARQ